MTDLKSITKRTLSVLLCMLMVLSVFMSVPFTASAEQIGEEQVTDTVAIGDADSIDIEVNTDKDKSDITDISANTATDTDAVFVVDGVVYSYKAVHRSGDWDTKVLYATGYDNETEIKNVVIPPTVEGVEVVGVYDNAFKNCKTLESVVVSDGIKYIEFNAFYGCSLLNSVILPDSVEVIEDDAFSYCKSLKTIDLPPIKDLDYCFRSCSALESLVIPKECEGIHPDAFVGCSALKSVIFEKGSILRSISSNAFTNCTSLESIEIPATVEGIAYEAFKGCTGLKSVVFAEGSKCVDIDDDLFSGCTSLEKVVLPEATEFIFSGAFENCYSLSDITIPEGVRLIGSRTFYNCKSLELLDMPTTLEHIGDEAFMNCESLYYVDIKSGLKKVEEKAFFNCHSLYEMVIPKSVEYIGEMAFGCYEKDGKYYSYGDFIVAGVKSSLADEYAEAYNMYWALNAPKLTKIENTSSGVKITFSKPSGASSGKYEVYRCTDNTEWKLLGTTTSLSYTDKTAKSGTKYYYTVQFIGKPTNSLNDYPLEMVRLSTPKVSKITNTNSGPQLTWGKITGAKKYNVYVKSSSGWKKLGDTTSTSFTHTAAKSGTSYTYTVRAYDSSGSYKSAYVSAGYTNKFIAPPTLKAVSNTTSGVKITWNKSTGATKYRVFVKSGSKWKKLGDTTKTSFTHKSAKSGTKYTYTVRCLSSTGKSYVSGYDKKGISYMHLSAPKVSKISNAQNGAKLTWGKVAGATKYNIYVKSSSGWKKLADTTKTSYTHTAAKSGKSYTYTVRAYDSSGVYKSAYVSAGYKNKFIATPVITSLSSTKKGVKISWGAVEGAVNYRVLVKTDSGWKKVGDTTSTSLVDKSAKSGKSYTYIVRCLSSTGKSYVSGYDKAGTTVTYKK